MITALLEAQNPDGGWGAQAGAPSWTETTAWALLASEGRAPTSEQVGRGAVWLRNSQLADGRWAAAPGIGEGCWVTAVAALLPADVLGSAAHARAVRGLPLGAEPLAEWTDRLRQWMLGHKPAPGPVVRGWPWVPGTAAWLVPTALSILAMRKAGAEDPLLEHARNYLFARQCNDGGWNHGSSRALGYDGAAYPETTGLALLALRGVTGSGVERGLVAAERLARRCQTFEGACWLRLALHVHGRTATFEPPARGASEVRELAIAQIVERSMAGEALLWTR